MVTEQFAWLIHKRRATPPLSSSPFLLSSLVLLPQFSPGKYKEILGTLTKGAHELIASH